MHSDTTLKNEKYPIGKSRTITAGYGVSINHIILDRRYGDVGEFRVRTYSSRELERLFLYPDSWTDSVSKAKIVNLIGNTVVVRVILGFIGTI